MSRNEIRIAGTGGQGVVTAGRILAEAAIMLGQEATHSQVYGPQSRGGACKSDVVMDTDTIAFPLADEVDFLIILSDKAYEKYQPSPDAEVRLIIDTSCAPDELAPGSAAFPVVDTAREISGGIVATGVVALGVLQAYTDLVDADTIRAAVAARVPAKHKEMNLKALAAGMELVGGTAA